MSLIKAEDKRGKGGQRDKVRKVRGSIFRPIEFQVPTIIPMETSVDSWKCILEKKSALERDLAISLANGRLKPSGLGVRQGRPRRAAVSLAGEKGNRGDAGASVHPSFLSVGSVLNTSHASAHLVLCCLREGATFST